MDKDKKEKKNKKPKVKAELTYNPYIKETRVKFNGRPPRINSLIEKYQDKKLQEWIKEIPSIFHDEMNGYNFILDFSGTAMDFHELEKSFAEAKVSKEQIALVFNKEMESRIVKTSELDDAIEWLEKNQNRRLDFKKFKSDNDDLLFGPFQFIIIGGNVKAINLYDNLKITPENVASTDDLKVTDLSNTPILFYLDRDTLPFLQKGLSDLIRKKNVSQNQIFFYIAPTLRKGMVKRIIRDLSVENPQIVDSLQDGVIKQYFEMFPVSDYISETLSVLRKKTNAIREQLTEEEQIKQEENKEKYALIHEYENNIFKLRGSEELFLNQEFSDITESWSGAKDKLISQISKWQARRTKVTGEAEGAFWADEFDKVISKSFGEFTQSILSSFYNVRENIKRNYSMWYRKAEVDSSFDTSEITCSDFAIGMIPPLKDEFLKMKEEAYVVPKDDNILGFFFSNQFSNQQKPQPEASLVVSYYLQPWREYAESAAGTRADQLISQAQEIFTKYQDVLTKTYVDHIEQLIEEETKKKDVETSSLSEEARLLQNDMDWLKEIEDKITRIERE